MSHQKLSTNTSASEDQEGVSLPSGSGIGNGKVTVFNPFVVDKIFATCGVDDSNNEPLSNVDQPNSLAVCPNLCTATMHMKSTYSCHF